MTLPSLLPVETVPVAMGFAWGVEEIREGHPTRVLCECGHDTLEEALACARPRSLDRLAELAYDTALTRLLPLPDYPTERPSFASLDPCGQVMWRDIAAAILRVVR